MFTFLNLFSVMIGHHSAWNPPPLFLRSKWAKLIRHWIQMSRTLQSITCENVLNQIITKFKIIILIVMKNQKRTISMGHHRPVALPTPLPVFLSAWVILYWLLLKENVWDNLCWLRIQLNKRVQVGVSLWVTCNPSLWWESVNQYQYNWGRIRDNN